MNRRVMLMVFLTGLFVLGWNKCSGAEEGHHHKEPEHEEHGHEHGEDEHGDHHDESAVHLKEESRKIAGLEIVKVKKEPFLNRIEVVGEIAKDTENITHITPPEAGILKSKKVNLGDVVDQGTPLFEIQTREGRLIEVNSPVHGIVMADYLKEGDPVDLISSVITIADPDLLRASFNVYEKDLAGISKGQHVIVKSLAYPEKEFEGEVVFISPQVDTKTRAVKIRANVKNEEHLLKFGMYVTGTILVPLKEQALVIPEEALQEVKGETVVFVPNPHEAGEFEMKEITIGRKVGNLVEVLEGIAEGENVAGKGSFYLKSELLKGELGHGHAH